MALDEFESILRLMFIVTLIALRNMFLSEVSEEFSLVDNITRLLAWRGLLVDAALIHTGVSHLPCTNSLNDSTAS